MWDIHISGFAELTVTVNPPRVIQVKSSSVMIDCTASGTAKTPTITWSIEGSPIQNTEDRKVFSNNTLYIRSLTKAYRGSYVCAANVDKQTITAVVKVDIASKSCFVYVLFSNGMLNLCLF